eukprot:756898-Hanusia_phi.AAC.3
MIEGGENKVVGQRVRVIWQGGGMIRLVLEEEEEGDSRTKRMRRREWMRAGVGFVLELLTTASDKKAVDRLENVLEH